MMQLVKKLHFSRIVIRPVLTGDDVILLFPAPKQCIRNQVKFCIPSVYTFRDRIEYCGLDWFGLG
jgi:hypothetical protein